MAGLLDYSKLFLKRNGSLILTCVGASGVVATSIMTAKATPKALRLVEEAEKEKGEKLTKTELVKTAGPAYIPAALTGIATITCIFGANVLNKHQQAALTSAYALIDRGYKEYRDKVKDMYGEEFDTGVRTEMAKNRYEEKGFNLQDDEQLFFDEFSMRYFVSTREDVRNAEYKFNRNFTLRGYATLNELYEMLEIPQVDYGNDVGWSMEAGQVYYGYSWVDFEHEKVIMNDGLECYIITMPFEPTPDYLGDGICF